MKFYLIGIIAAIAGALAAGTLIAINVRNLFSQVLGGF